MEEFALERLGMDPLEFKRLNWIKVGQELPLAKAMGEGREGFEQTVRSNGLEECVTAGKQAVGWERRFDPAWKTGPGAAAHSPRAGAGDCMHGTGIAGLDMGAASIKLNDDGSFNLLMGATDLGTGSDTVLAQIAAETLGVPLDKVLVYSSDTDFTPFDTGAYASSTTYISRRRRAQGRRGCARADRAPCRQPPVHRHRGRSAVAGRWRGRGAGWPPRQPGDGGAPLAAPGTRWSSTRSWPTRQPHVASVHQSAALCCAQFAEVEVDTETGQVTCTKLVMAVDCGIAINPVTATGQVEGGMVQALGYALCEEMVYDNAGRLLNPRLGDYRIFAADEVPALKAILVQTYEPSGPYGAKAVAEIPMDGVAPAIASAIRDATGLRLRQLPFTPERVWEALAG